MEKAMTTRYNRLTIDDIDEISSTPPDEISLVDYNDLVWMARVGAAYLITMDDARRMAESDDSFLDWFEDSVEDMI
jgi:hypothetical protein